MEKSKSGFSAFLESLDESDRRLIDKYFSEFELHFSLPKKELKKFRADFEGAIMLLFERGVSVEETLSRLSLSNLGGFYARSAVAWYPLDDAAKIYPVSMEHGRQQIFRLSVYFKEEIIPQILQIALSFTIKRFPSFATTLKKGFFWHYLDAVKRHFSIEAERDVLCQPIKVSLSGSKSFRIIYYKNRVSAEFFHILTDGTGGMIFLKALCAEYLRLLGVRAPLGDIWNVNDTPVASELENAFLKVERAKASSGFVDKPALQMNGKLAKRKPCRVLHFKLDATALHKKAKELGTTVTSYLTMQMLYALRASTDETSGDLHIQIPVNMRKYYPSRTVRNFSMYCGVKIPLEANWEREELVSEISRQIKEKSAKEKMHEMITATVKLVGSIRLVPLVIKQPIAKTVYGFLGEKLYTSTFSNLGVVDMPKEFDEHIAYMDFCLGAQMTNRLACTAVTFGNTCTFTVSKMTSDPSFEEKMYDLLKADGLETEVEGSDYYAN